ncbi:MAG: hypothetical protein P8N63_15825 [Pseudomonadales bacterium]|jgi:hypothetical protein|nr:hypothetical protein [Pseudomonadales bacterium]
MKNIFVRIGLVVVATAVCTWIVPGIDDAIESVFQILVLIAST